MKCYPIDDVWNIVFTLQDITDKEIDDYVNKENNKKIKNLSR